ncbi:MAG TPA: rhodanese-like domain-containing protein [Cellulomonas sp.]
MTDPLLTPDALAAELGRPGLLVLDATVDLPRPRHDGDHRAASGRPGWADAHLPGAQHLDLLSDFTEPGAPFHFAHPSAARARGVLAALGVSDGDDLVLYDRADGFWSARAWWSLRAHGLDVRVLDGGLTAWRAAGHTVHSGPEPVPARSVAPARLPGRPGLWATREDVAAVVAGTVDARLVCALGEEQFAGTAPTRYSRRGHIPGSVSLPARSLADAGRLLPPLPLRTAVAAALPDPDRPVILYCGGGIAASFAALGLVAAGRRDVRVYDGSLEEWSADPALPLVL